jgi:hypothetical protein
MLDEKWLTLGKLPASPERCELGEAGSLIEALQPPLASGLITACPRDLSATDQDGNCALRHDFIRLAAEDQTP